jgi:hypothetical protein
MSKIAHLDWPGICKEGETVLLLTVTLMKTSLLAIFSFLPCLALADSSSTSTDRLNLSPSQQEAIKPILVAEADKRKSIEDDTTLSVQEKHDQTGEVHRASLQQIKALFTPEQMAQIEQGQAHPQPSPTSPSTSSTQTSP